MTPSGLERFKWFYHRTPTSKANRNYWLLQGPHDSGSFPPPLLCPFVFSVLPRVKDIIFLWKLSDRWAVLWVTSISHITVLNCDSLLFSITHTHAYTHTQVRSLHIILFQLSYITRAHGITLQCIISLWHDHTRGCLEQKHDITSGVHWTNLWRYYNIKLHNANILMNNIEYFHWQ